VVFSLLEVFQQYVSVVGSQEVSGAYCRVELSCHIDYAFQALTDNSLMGHQASRKLCAQADAGANANGYGKSYATYDR